MHYKYQTQGTCSKEIEFDLINNRLFHVKFVGGCNGNLKAISRLVEGMRVEELEKRCKGITCGLRDTSCIDQLVHAVKEVKGVNTMRDH
ncbi:MAG: TIGR03905 family TSCPD domain-containing protein [Bacilli bacterium]|nr:TIGR03905 family TSCPD domain-containing protein [Bacilli bacterium]